MNRRYQIYDVLNLLCLQQHTFTEVSRQKYKCHYSLHTGPCYREIADELLVLEILILSIEAKFEIVIIY